MSAAAAAGVAASGAGPGVHLEWRGWLVFGLFVGG